jgi:hypothetical protein
MLDNMPVPNLTAMLLAMAPAAAAELLLAMPGERIEVLAAALPDERLGRLLVAAPAAQRYRLLGAIPTGARRVALSRLSRAEAVQLVTGLEIEMGWAVLRELPLRTAADAFAELAPATREAYRRRAPTDLPVEFDAGVYERSAATSVARIAHRVYESERRPGDLVAEVLGRPVQIAVRFVRAGPLTDLVVHDAAVTAIWHRVLALVVLSNASADGQALHHIEAFRATGRPVVAHRWLDGRDDGDLKRLLVHVVA